MYMGPSIRSPWTVAFPDCKTPCFDVKSYVRISPRATSSPSWNSTSPEAASSPEIASISRRWHKIVMSLYLRITLPSARMDLFSRSTHKASPVSCTALVEPDAKLQGDKRTEQRQIDTKASNTGSMALLCQLKAFLPISTVRRLEAPSRC